MRVVNYVGATHLFVLSSSGLRDALQDQIQDTLLEGVCLQVQQSVLTWPN